jgi:hypothetical protein
MNTLLSFILINTLLLYISIISLNLHILGIYILTSSVAILITPIYTVIFVIQLILLGSTFKGIVAF